MGQQRYGLRFPERWGFCKILLFIFSLTIFRFASGIALTMPDIETFKDIFYDYVLLVF